MSLTAMPATRPARQGCGCGGDGCGGDGCGCGGCGGTPMQQPAFVRPRFFAGQLLTDLDLEALTAYVTGKHRLHNRHLFGPGVVCGLEVVCHPCGGGKVRVQPGYALDCCGNDLVVACPAELDVNELVRDLRVGGLGEDCGDPCREAEEEGNDDATSENGSRCYYLYARYVEEGSDPVAAYATEEPCGHQGCEPSRIREGVRFLLRCRPERPPPDDRETRVRACRPPPAVDRQVERLGRYGRSLLAAGRPVGFDATDAQRLMASLDTLGRTMAQAGGGPERGAERARVMGDRLGALAGALARFDLQDEPTREGMRTEHRLDLDRARSTLDEAAQALSGTVEDELLAQARRVAASERPGSMLEARMLALGEPFGPGRMETVGRELVDLRQWLLDRLDQDTNLTDCELRTLVAGISPGRATAAGPTDEAAAQRAGAAAITLTEAFQRYLLACSCAAFNPPCRPCDDPDVLLACIEVRDCEVVSICNPVRDYVLTAPAVRHWVPAIGRLRDRFEQRCCGPPAREEAAAEDQEPALALLGLDLSGAFEAPAPSREEPLEARLAELSHQVAALSDRLADTRIQLGREKAKITRLQQKQARNGS